MGRRAVLLLVPCGLALLSTGSRAFGAAQEPPSGFRLIVHPDVAAQALDREFVADVFLKKATRWPDSSPIAAVDLRFGSPVRQSFSERVLLRSASAVRSYWQQRIFTGRGVPPPELDSDEAVIRYVQSRRGAVGYVSEKAALGAVKVVSVR
jgi:ABC-type phosphate transport system substrate-binding protein